jgi:NlpC/P60 family/Bacterial dipeptidyl-peptidase Sh3 domain
MSLPLSTDIEYTCRANLNLYSSIQAEGLASQVAAGRRIKVVDTNVENQVVRVRSVEDDYPGWLLVRDLRHLEPSVSYYEPKVIDRPQIEQCLPAVIAFVHRAMRVPNQYLWGGTVAPDYDCSGLMQAAFMSEGIWLPRDSYQQEAFVQHISIEELIPGDLIFFGTPQKTDHVAIHLGEREYLHSSGVEMGRNGIGIDLLSPNNPDKIGLGYWRKFRCCGRVMSSYQSLGCGR